MNKQKKEISLVMQCFGEFIGTGIITFFEIGCMFASTLTTMHLNYLEMNFICGMSLSIAIYISSFLSESHLNPSVTVCLWIFNQFCKAKVIYYIISQLLGSFFATSLIYYIYVNALNDFEIKHNIVRGSLNSVKIASLFTSYPSIDISLLKLFNTEVLMTTIFVILLMLVFNTKKNICKRCSFINHPFIIGMIIFLLETIISPIIHFTFNPARDLSPRIFIASIGWGKIAFTGGISAVYFLIPILGPFVGAILGMFIYKLIFNYKY